MKMNETLCNVAIDVMLLIATVYVVDAFLSTLRYPSPLWSQRYGRVDPDFLRNADGHRCQHLFRQWWSALCRPQ